MRTDITKTSSRQFNTNIKPSTAINEWVPTDFKRESEYSRTDISLNRYSEIENLRSKFYFDSENLDSFLLDNFEVVKFLQRAHNQLSEILPGSIFILEVNSDFEVDDWKTLFLNILNNLQDSTFNERLQGFIMDWMFVEKPEIRRLVTIKEIC